jgi:hypothetical protein
LPAAPWPFRPTATGWCSRPPARMAWRATGCGRSTPSKPAPFRAPKLPTFRQPGSWDSRFVLFSTSAKLQKVDIQGGPAQLLAELPNLLNGATSNKEGVIVVGLSPTIRTPLLRVPAGGGTPTPVTALAKGETRHVFPQFLPDGRHFLYLRVSNDPNQMGSISARSMPNRSSRASSGSWPRIARRTMRLRLAVARGTSSSSGKPL